MSTTAVAADWRVPATRPQGRPILVAALLGAAGLGVAIGVAPRPTLAMVLAAVAVVVLLPRLEWAVCAVVAAAVFDSYLDVVSPWSTSVLTLLLVLAWLVRRARGPVGSRRWWPAMVATVAFLVVLATATDVHPNGRPGAEVVTLYVALAVVLLVLLDALAGPVRAHRVVRAYVAACVLAAGCGLVTAVADTHHRVDGPLANPDDLAFFLVAAVPLAGIPRYRHGWQRSVVIVVLVLATIGTQSRGAMVAVAVMLVTALGVRAVSVRAAALWLLLVATGVALVLAVVVPRAGHRIGDTQRYVETRVSQRLSVWRAAGTMTRDHPVLGLGPAAFALYHADYRDQPRSETDAMAGDLEVAHSTPLQASAELGGLGAVALFAVFLVPAVGSRRRWLVARSRLTVGVTVALVGLVVASLFETEQFVLPLWLLAALACPIRAPDDGSVGRLPLFGRHEGA